MDYRTTTQLLSLYSILGESGSYLKEEIFSSLSLVWPLSSQRLVFQSGPVVFTEICLSAQRQRAIMNIRAIGYC